MCQRVKLRRCGRASKLQALPLPIKPFVLIIMDFITNLPLSVDTLTKAVYDSILVIIDQYTKFVRYILCQKTISIIKLTQLFIRHQFVNKGLPINVVTNRGLLFTSKFQAHLYYYLNVSRGLLIVFYTQTNRQTKCQNQMLEMWLRCYMCYMQDNQVNLLPLEAFAYNNAFYEAIQMLLFKAMHGYLLDTC